MKIFAGSEKEYQDWYDKNDNAYGRACLEYAERWANLLEEEIGTSTDMEEVEKIIEENAKRLSHKTDTEGITGFMYGCAVSFLADCWKYGEFLRQWHNKEFHYSGNGVINPSVLYLG